MKRIMSVFLALFVIVGLSPPTRAAGTPTVSITSGEVSAGGEVTLTLSIQDNPGVAATLVYIYYNTSVFTVEPGTDLAAAGAFRSSGGLIGNTIALAKENGRYDGMEERDGVLALWYNSSGLNTSQDGAMLTITLHAREGAPDGSYAVEVGYSKNDTCNEKGEDVALQAVGGTVKVSGGNGQTEPEDGPDAAKPGDSPEDPSAGKPGEEPSGPVDEKPEDAGIDAQPETPLFSDVSGHWAETYILQAADRGLVEGYNGLFRPDDTMTRAECVTILWRASGEPEPAKAASFTDLDQDWYLDAVAWAEENGVVKGVGGGKFDPYGAVSREQLVTILHRLAGTPTGMEMLLTGVYDGQYPDSGEISSWAKAALYWAVYKEIYCGEASAKVGQTLAPTAAANRAQIAVMIVRYLDKQ